MIETRKYGRRSFLKFTAFSVGCQALAPAFQGLLARDADSRRIRGFGPLRPVQDQTTGLPLMELPEGFEYSSFGWTGDEMVGGQRTPGAHDGMAVISEEKGLITLCRNHELKQATKAFGESEITYDSNAGGGCSNLEFNSRTGEWVKAWPSLSGTVKNCAGGPTPWNTWLSCEETVLGPGDEDDGERFDFTKTHGWIFEVSKDGNTSPEPLTDMGRFVHEAIAVDPDTGLVYETEDRGTAGFYRFRPNTAGKLSDGGTLEMLRVKGEADLRKSSDTGKTYECEWVLIEDPSLAHADPKAADELGCYTQGKQQGATTFARLEGCWYGNHKIYFDATSGGPAGAGQIWEYDPRNEQLRLLFASPSNEVLDQPDNLAVSPRGGIILCEDGDRVPQRLHGLTPNGELFTFANNNVQLNGERNGLKGDFRGSEWAGASFSSDGKWLFVNLQSPGITFAITGPWQDGLL
ncbi:MAG: DUF839 domain-containing protein [Planctomycetaceae bacterium]|nr:DUF839 domain-containing protein [Planctomycetaceae bacterium]